LALEIERRLLAELGLAGKRMTVTIVACQLTDFIQSLEEDNPEEILQNLNECLALMMQSVGGHGGLVERIWNCGVIGMWGAPIEMDEGKQARQAAACVIDINKRMREFQQTKEQQPARLTCSINTGEAICGTINAAAGDSILTHYGALGPCVDAAIQLESYNTTYGITCMVGTKTAQLLEDQYELRELDRKEIAGESESIYEFVSANGPLGGVREEAMEVFRRGKTAFSEGRVTDAEQLFATSLSMLPNDKPSMVMLQRCREHLDQDTSLSKGRQG
jgi:class 3 adenylate cyclase